MSHVVNIYDAKTQLSRLLEEALTGEDVVIARNGTPLVRLVPISQSRKITFGVLTGDPNLGPAFDEEDPAIQAMFEGRNKVLDGAVSDDATLPEGGRRATVA